MKQKPRWLGNRVIIIMILKKCKIVTTKLVIKEVEKRGEG